MEQHLVQQLIDSYQTTYIRATKDISEIINSLDREISTEQFFFLRELKKTDGISATDMAKRLNVNKSAITSKIKHLEEKRYIKKEVNLSDKRSMIVSMTDKGAAFTVKCEQVVERLIATWLNQLGDEESSQFVHLYSQFTTEVFQHVKEENN
ncbi:MarR family winged helix-turn-helix transcriptional regulator [Listeria sp. PSOL-1]|uniref:MarR family winged helix-turn-helix transcriptional regulator n=1 Tax=Listeria sp. PSOL-1 TaxID=1844999 RepID=UPI0013D123BC|nr:MarR family transcriptional regulator [Listeria sp. PSOL-1]